MKSKTKHILQQILVNDVTYRIFQPLVFLADRLKASRANYLDTPAHVALDEAARKIFADRIVCNGPFKGLRLHTEATESGSTYAMLLGSFESEIQPYIIAAVKKQYAVIVNIGCADAYYAVGLALNLPASIVYAFDADKKALAKARRNAMANNVQNRIKFSGLFSAKSFSTIDLQKKSLFIVDCEGAERNIFTKDTAPALRHADLIIEMHINIYPDLEDHFTRVFSATHDIKVIDSVDDHLKAKYYSFPQIDGLDYNLRRFITEERAVFMQWIVLSAKNSS